MRMPDINIGYATRACYIGNEKCVFHQWGQSAGGQEGCLYALIEHANGSITMELPTDVQFVQSKIFEHHFPGGLDSNVKED